MVTAAICATLRPRASCRKTANSRSLSISAGLAAPFAPLQTGLSGDLLTQGKLHGARVGDDRRHELCAEALAVRVGAHGERAGGVV